jgi:hypothetical protein
MRIQEITTSYENQKKSGHFKKKDDFKKNSIIPETRQAGCIDMLSFSTKISDSDQALSELIDYIHLIPDEAMHDWIQETFYQSNSKDDIIAEKLLMEIF